MNDVPGILLYGEHLVQLQVKSVVRTDLLSQQQQEGEHQQKHKMRQENWELWPGRYHGTHRSLSRTIILLDHMKFGPRARLILGT